MFSQIIATGLLALSVGAPTRQNANVNSNAAFLFGTYNLKDTFVYNDIIDEYGTNWGSEIYFNVLDEDNNHVYDCPFSYNNNNQSNYQLQKIEMFIASSEEYVLDIYLIDMWANTQSINIELNNGESIDDINSLYNQMTFDVLKSQYLDDVTSALFNVLFTHDDNKYTTTYSGYYNFSSNPTRLNWLTLFGTITFNNNIDLGWNTYGWGNSETNNQSNAIMHYNYNVETGKYGANTYSLPFGQDIVQYTNILLTDVKMTKTTYNYLSGIGVFNYVRDTSFDNSTFGDLLFSVMDTPIYFLSSLMSFELFGTQMFVAFTGLLTIVVILLCIRKFW